MNRKKQTTMKRFLLPHAFQKAGWWLLLASLVAGAAVLVLDTISGPLPDGAVTADAAKTQPLMQAVIIGAQLSIFLIACSREKVEDEMVSSTRHRIGSLRPLHHLHRHSRRIDNHRRRHGQRPRLIDRIAPDCILGIRDCTAHKHCSQP